MSIAFLTTVMMRIVMKILVDFAVQALKELIYLCDNLFLQRNNLVTIYVIALFRHQY